MPTVIPDLQHMDIALSGSSTKLPAHIGFLKSLEDHNIRPIRVAANSGGSLIAALWLTGKSPEEIQDIALEVDFSQFLSLDWKAFVRLISRGYLSSGVEYLKLLQRLFGKKRLEEIETPFFVMTSNMTIGSLEIISQKTHPKFPLALAVYASSCLPLGFKPLEFNGFEFQDGGIYKDFPIDIWDDYTNKRIGHLVGKSRTKPILNSAGIKDRAMVLVDRIIDANVDHSLDRVMGKNVLIVDSDGYELPALDFKLDANTKNGLYEQGIVNTTEVLKPYVMKTKISGI